MSTTIHLVQHGRSLLFASSNAAGPHVGRSNCCLAKAQFSSKETIMNENDRNEIDRLGTKQQQKQQQNGLTTRLQLFIARSILSLIKEAQGTTKTRTMADQRPLMNWWFGHGRKQRYLVHDCRRICLVLHGQTTTTTTTRTLGKYACRRIELILGVD